MNDEVGSDSTGNEGGIVKSIYVSTVATQGQRFIQFNGCTIVYIFDRMKLSLITRSGINSAPIKFHMSYQQSQPHFLRFVCIPVRRPCFMLSLKSSETKTESKAYSTKHTAVKSEYTSFIYQTELLTTAVPLSKIKYLFLIPFQIFK